MDISPIIIIIWSISILIIGLSIIVLVGGKRLSSKIFSASIFIVSLWIIGVGSLIFTEKISFAIYNIRINYFLGNLIANSFYLLFLVFPDKSILPKKPIIITFIIQIILFYIYVFTDLIISNIHYSNEIKNWIWQFGKFSYIFEVTFISLFIMGVIKLIGNYNYHKNKAVRKNIIFMLQTIIIGLFPTTILCIILPRIGVYSMNWIGPIAQIVWIPIIMYSIIKYRQMSVRHIMSITLTVLVLVIFILSYFINFTKFNLIKEVIFLFFILIIGYLISYLSKDYKKMLAIHKTNISLSKIIEYQTSEIRNAYAIEHKARNDLEKLNETKDQFIMITQHNLRSPITTIRSELELLINGHKGNIDEEVLYSIIKTKSSADRLSQIVDDFLNITTIKIGSEILKLAQGNIGTIISNIIHDLRLEIEEMKLDIDFIESENFWPNIKMDINKIKEALTIIIENAVRYNFKRGKINISNEIVDDNLVLSIENTGVGITEEEKYSLFNKLFYRGIRARERNPIGMGIGLQVARAIINGHNGRIEINSLGENYGAKVNVILPINFYYED